MSEKKAEITELTGKCPTCDSTQIASYDRVYATARVACFYRAPDGTVDAEYAGESDVDWNSQEPVDRAKPFVCLDCGQRLSLDQIKLVSESARNGDTAIPLPRYAFLLYYGSRLLTEVHADVIDLSTQEVRELAKASATKLQCIRQTGETLGALIFKIDNCMVKVVALW